MLFHRLYQGLIVISGKLSRIIRQQDITNRRITNVERQNNEVEKKLAALQKSVDNLPQKPKQATHLEIVPDDDKQNK